MLGNGGSSCEDFRDSWADHAVVQPLPRLRRCSRTLPKDRAPVSVWRRTLTMPTSLRLLLLLLLLVLLQPSLLLARTLTRDDAVFRIPLLR